MDILELLRLFFTHKDFLPPASEMPGTIFTPLHFIVAAIYLIVTFVLGFYIAKKDEKTIKKALFILWVILIILEPAKILWESFSGKTVSLEATGILPLYPCSIYMYALPLIIFGNKYLRYMGCGYVCSLGLLGGAINFFYPANVLNNYSCISFAGFHTLFYHASIVFGAVVILRSGLHSYKDATKWWHLILPACPALAVSVIANIVNFSPINSDYMFFKLNSFFFAPLGAALPTAVCVIIVYIIYLIIHSLPYLPFYLKNKITIKEDGVVIVEE